MSIQIYFINETKKQVVSTKKLYGNFEDNQQLLCYLSLCAGDTFRTELEGGQWIEKFLYEEKHKDFKHIKLYEFKIRLEEDLYDSKEFDRLYNHVYSI
jgi:hypothetical protein